MAYIYIAIGELNRFNVTIVIPISADKDNFILYIANSIIA